MKGSLAVLGLAGAVMANPMPQVTSAIAPSAAAPSGCSTSHSGMFDLSVVNVTSSSKRDVQSRQSSSTLMLTLSNGVLKDSQGRTGYIAANQQFQFDNPPQTGAIYTAGWSVCGNNSMALGGSAIFYQCLSGTFYNLYAKSQGNQCAAVYFETSASSGSSSSAAGSASQISDGQPQATTGTAKASQISDGQPQATTGSAKVSQISDGQPQATTATSAKVSQISDGQPQATTGASSAKVSQISDGQPQATTAAASSAKVSQISDGQPQATTGASSAKVSQISDGQPQATTKASAAATTSAAKVSQISDGQPQATTAAVATFTGAADRNMAGRYAFAAGIVGAVALL